MAYLWKSSAGKTEIYKPNTFFFYFIIFHAKSMYSPWIGRTSFCGHIMCIWMGQADRARACRKIFYCKRVDTPAWVMHALEKSRQKLSLVFNILRFFFFCCCCMLCLSVLSSFVLCEAAQHKSVSLGTKNVKKSKLFLMYNYNFMTSLLTRRSFANRAFLFHHFVKRFAIRRYYCEKWQ